MWAMYIQMRMGKRLWEFAAEGADEGCNRCLQERTGFWGYCPIDDLKNASWQCGE
jgi:hypothetical protein